MDSNFTTATEIGEFIRFSSCQRRFKLAHNGRKAARNIPFYDQLVKSLDPVLQHVGEQNEVKWERALVRDHKFVNVCEGNSAPIEWSTFLNSLKSIEKDKKSFFREVEIYGQLGDFEVKGRIDFILIDWTNSIPTLRIVELKASRKDKTYQRLQLAIYYQLFSTELDVIKKILNINKINFEAVVGRINEDDNTLQDIFSLEGFDLKIELQDLHYLTIKGGELDRILNSSLSELPYQLNSKCDQCVFNTHCLTESARERRIELLGISTNNVRVLRKNGLETIDDVANIDHNLLLKVQSDPDFNINAEHLIVKAITRCSTLPNQLEPSPKVVQLPNCGSQTSQLPIHIIEGQRLVRVYTTVEFDYTENRLIGIAAHVTNSENNLHTGFFETIDGKIKPDPKVHEINPDTKEASPLNGIDVIVYQHSPWSGDFGQDSGREQSMLAEFFGKVVNAIASIVNDEYAPVHFYVWSRQEMSDLIDACTRAGSKTLSNFQELMGCRASLEQLIFSSVQDEIKSRFALGWTSNGRSVASSLNWYGDRFHWVRNVRNKPEPLDQTFTQGLFDFKTDLFLSEQNEWLSAKEIENLKLKQNTNSLKNKFEIRSRFNDGIPVPYWYALWRKFSDIDLTKLQGNAKQDIERFKKSARPLVMDEFLKARAHCLRWLEEKVKFKNPDIDKPVLHVENLPDFSLNVNDIARASLDFLRLEHHVKVNDWLTSQLDNIENRVARGKTLVLQNFSRSGDTVNAEIVCERYGLTLKELSKRSTLSGFGRVTKLPESGSQTFNMLLKFGTTVVINDICWESGRVSLEELRSNRGSNYILGCAPVFENSVLVTLDESVSDFVFSRVDGRLEDLRNGTGNVDVLEWLDPTEPNIPKVNELSEALRQRSYSIINAMKFDDGNGNSFSLSDDQKEALFKSLNTKIFQLQGPPGTGKTQTTAVETLLKILNCSNENSLVIVAANTHTAVDTLLRRIEKIIKPFSSACDEVSVTFNIPFIRKIVSKNDEDNLLLDESENIQKIKATSVVKRMNEMLTQSPLIIGSTTSTVLKWAKDLNNKPSFNSRNGVAADILIIDEASMLVFPSFLALASLVAKDGRMTLAGDNRQLSPILSHNWAEEERPPIELYQPHMSAYDAIVQLETFDTVQENQISIARLNKTWRLPDPIRELIQTVYKQDDITLTGRKEYTTSGSFNFDNDFSTVWKDNVGVFLVVHEENESRLSNEFEAKLIHKLVSAIDTHKPKSIAIITPHRAQRTLLSEELVDEKCISLIDTVERLQGNEESTIIYSGTESDPSSITSNAEFILNLNRSNVAFSRSKERLIVVCSKSLINHIPADIENYRSASLWKSLRTHCSTLVETLKVDSISVEIYTSRNDG
jgi:hypothetical protein